MHDEIIHENRSFMSEGVDTLGEYHVHLDGHRIGPAGPTSDNWRSVLVNQRTLERPGRENGIRAKAIMRDLFAQAILG